MSRSSAAVSRSRWGRGDLAGISGAGARIDATPALGRFPIVKQQILQQPPREI